MWLHHKEGENSLHFDKKNVEMIFESVKIS